jgi:hypothetical protein
VADQSETAFNEIDTPVNQPTPVDTWVRFSAPHKLLIIFQRSLTRTSEVVRASIEPTSLAMHWHLSTPMRELLCTFLI